MSLVLTAHQPQYLPGLRLFAKIAQADTFCLLDTVQYERKSWENRNYIKTQHGPLMLTVPVASHEHFKKTGGDIEIIRTGWQRKHLRSIALAYGNAEFFEMYMPDLERIIGGDHVLLADLNKELLSYMLACFGITTKILIASDFAFKGEKSFLVLDMCKQLGATKYIFGALGEDYADKQAFADAGIEIEFQDYKHPVYDQLHGEFAANMSAIDLLMNCGPYARDTLLSGNV